MPGVCKDPEVRRQAAKIAGLARQAQGDVAEITRPAHKGLKAKFEAEVDPTGTLSPAERERRGKLAFRAHMAKLSLRSSRVRKARRVDGAGSR